MTTTDWSIHSATFLLKDVLPDIIEVASYYATSSDRVAHDAREALRLRNQTRPFHVVLHQYLGQLDSALGRMPTRLKEINSGDICLTLIGFLDLLEDSIVVSPSSHRVVRWPKFSQRSRTYANLLRWTACGRALPAERLPWLLNYTRLAKPSDSVRLKLLNTVQSCSRAIEAYLPVDPAPLEDDERVMASAREIAAWRNVRELCNGMESVHQQLATAWQCRCAPPHQGLHFAINPCRPLVDGFVASSILHDSSGWKQTFMQMKYANSAIEPLSYQEFCEDLSASSVVRLWYEITMCNSCTQPMTFEQLCHRMDRPPLPKQRLCLAVILSHLYLHLGGGAWWPYTRTDTIIHFQGAGPASRLPLNAPLFPFVTEQDPGPDFRAQCINPAMPSIVEFGKLLLEILTWEPCSWEGHAFEQRLKALQARDTDLANSDRILVAVIACTGYRGEDRLKAKAHEQTIRESERTRMEFVNVVIRNLEYVLREAYDVDSDAIFSSVELDVQPRRIPTFSSPIESRSEQAGPVAITPRNPIQGPSTRTLPEPESSVLNDDTGLTEVVDSGNLRAADNWQQKLLPLYRLLPEDNEVWTKVAVLDTGLHLDPDIADAYDNRVESYCFLADGATPELLAADEDGHGTHVATIVLEVGANCKVYSARVCRSRKDVRDKKSSREVAHRIARTIIHAVDVWQVDIISMSFGFTNRSKVVADAVKYAYDHKVLVLAAAGNNGSMERVRYPARDVHALCIHAATGSGDMYNGNPTRKENSSNFALVGVAVKGYGRQSSTMIRRSGTSQATAVAAGVASVVLQVMRAHQGATQARMLVSAQRYDTALLQVKELDGMRRIFERMSRRRGDYEIVEPWSLLEDIATADSSMIPCVLCHSIIALMDEQDDE